MHGDTIESAARPARRWSKRVWALAAFVVTTVLTAAISWVVTTFADRAQERFGDPIVVTVESDPTRVSAFGSEPRAVAVPAGPVTAPDPGAGCSGLYAWARARAGMDAGRSLLHVFVRGDVAGEVVIEAMRAVIDRRQPPPAMLELACFPEGELQSRRLTIDLDSSRPIARYVTPESRPFGFTVQKGEVEAFLITATAATSSVWWHLEIDVVDGGHRTTVRADDGGRPFVTAPRVAAGRWQWGADAWNARDLGPGAVAPPPVLPGQPLPPLPVP
jgi:hypothetical protein